jgi:RNA polymerase sigma-70 factor (ECF subfamily)
MSARRDDDKMELSVVPTAPAPSSGAPLRMPGDDEALLQRIAARDRDAFEALYKRYARPVYALALRRLGEREGAEEAVQETFAAVWRSARSFRAERGAASSWLYAIARNAVVDRFRSRPEPVADPPERVSEQAGPDERAEREWVAWRVHTALAELPERERRVLELAYWSGLSQSEVAERLDIPLGTVKTRTRSGLARLGRLLEGEDVR